MDNNTMKISSLEMASDSVILIPNREVKNLTNATCYRIIICCNVEASANLPVFVRTNIGDIPVLCRFGNTLYANHLNKRRMYRIGYGNENSNYELGQFVIQGNVNLKSEIVVPVSL